MSSRTSTLRALPASEQAASDGPAGSRTRIGLSRETPVVGVLQVSLGAALLGPWQLAAAEKWPDPVLAWVMAGQAGVVAGLALGSMLRTERVRSPYRDAVNAMPRIATHRLRWQAPSRPMTGPSLRRVDPAAGSVTIRGTELRDAREHLGFMLARDALLPRRTARRNVEYGLEPRRAGRDYPLPGAEEVPGHDGGDRRDQQALQATSPAAPLTCVGAPQARR